MIVLLCHAIVHKYGVLSGRVWGRKGKNQAYWRLLLGIRNKQRRWEGPNSQLTYHSCMVDFKRRFQRLIRKLAKPCCHSKITSHSDLSPRKRKIKKNKRGEEWEDFRNAINWQNNSPVRLWFLLHPVCLCEILIPNVWSFGRLVFFRLCMLV